LRIIAGEAHGRRLDAPRGCETRPATARVRSSIFSRLEARGGVAHARVLDIFAGSGSLGLEALSRGAARAVFVDSSKAAAISIGRNLRELGLAARGRILTLDFRRALSALAAAAEQFELVFVDAPYARDASAEVLAILTRLDLIAQQGIAVVRQYRRAPALEAAALECISSATLGDHHIAIYRRR
jgi:16S rRNA (guanine966-N2)-methyltransferase